MALADSLPQAGVRSTCPDMPLRAAGQGSGSTASPSKLHSGFLPSCLPLTPAPQAWQRGSNGPRRHTLPLAFRFLGDTCPREGAQALLAGAGAAVSRAGVVPPAWRLKSPAPASSSPHPSSSRGDFPTGRTQGTGPGTCCRSHAQLQPKTAAGSRRLREEEEQDLLGMPPRSQPALSPATRKRARGAGLLVTQPPHTAPAAPADHTLLFSHNPYEMQKWGAKLSTGMAAVQGTELTVSLSSGQEQLGKLVLPARHGPAERRRVCKLFSSSHVLWSWVRPAFAAELPVAFSRCLSAQLWISLKCGGKRAPKGPGGCKSQRAGPPHFLWGSRGAAPHSGGGRAWVLPQVPPRAPRQCPPAPPPAADVVTLGPLVRGTQRGGFL